MTGTERVASYAGLRDAIVADAREHGLGAALRAHGRDIVAQHVTGGAPHRMLGRDLFEILTTDPELADHFAGLPSEQAARLRAELENGPAAAPPEDSPSHHHFVGGLRDALLTRRAPHPELREGDGSPVQWVERAAFQNWGRTVRNDPAFTFVPRTKTGVCNVVRWAAAQGKTVRAAGYRHSWSDLFSADDQVLISLLSLYDVEHLPAPEPPIDPADELQGIEIVGTVHEDGVTKALCRIGAATTNEQFRRWCLSEGNSAWTVPLNVIMVEITWGGSNAPICHGAGWRHPTLSDLVVEVEFVNAKGQLQVVSDPKLLKTAAGCFGLLGIVTSITLKLDPMSYATLRPEKPRLALTIPPPPGWKVPAAVDMSGIRQADLDQAWKRFVDQCENDYYAEWFWFPYQADCWVNCWKNDGRSEDARPYPGTWGTWVQQAEGYLAELATTTVFRLLSGRRQAELLGAVAMASLPTGDTLVTPVIEALHFRRGIQNFRTLDMELEIPIPPRPDDRTRPDWTVCQKAWWAAIGNVLERKDAPMRITLEMRIMGGSDVTMAPQHGNRLGTCAIEVLSTLQTPHDQWIGFLQEITDLWTSYTGPDGEPLNVRPHWAKDWQRVRFRGRPAVEYARDVAYTDRIPEFRSSLEAIAAQGGYRTTDLRRFSNPLLDEIFADVFT
jgi:hypothetical protein